MFSYKISEKIQKTIFIEYLWTTAPGDVSENILKNNFSEIFFNSSC